MKTITDLKTANLCDEIQISVMNRMPNYLAEMFANRGVGCKIHINSKYLKMNSIRKYLDFEVNGKCKILYNKNCHD
jgi:hypothetical protein